MINNSKRLEALIAKHWKTLVRGKRGMYLDAYNCSVRERVAGTITTRIDAGNLWFVTENPK